MSTTIREQIIASVVAHLEEIRTGNNYATEIGRRVLRARTDIDPDELPALVVWPMPEDVDAGNKKYGYSIATFPLTLVGLSLFEPADASITAEQMLGDLIYAMTYPGKTPAGSLADKILYAGGGTDSYPEPGQSIVGASAVFNVTYTTKKGDPYTQ